MTKEDFTKNVIKYIHTLKIIDSIEEVDDELFYSKTVRVICVTDENFDDSLDGMLSFFYADTLGQTDCYESYDSEYGVVRIHQEETGNVTVAFAAEEEEE